MEISSKIIDTPPRDAATVLILREGSSGLEVLLLKRHADSKDLAGAFVFPGGKRDETDASPSALASLDQPLSVLHAQLGESDIAPEHAGSLFVAALREAQEECGLQLRCTDLRPWSRWITPRRPAMTNCNSRQSRDNRNFVGKPTASADAILGGRHPFSATSNYEFVSLESLSKCRPCARGCCAKNTSCDST